VQKGDLKAIQQHIAAGSDLNAKDRTGWTALHLAAMKGDLVMVKTLTEAGADRSIKGLGARTALDLARERSKPAVVQYLEAHAAKPGRGLVDGGLGVSGVLDSQ
jgi:ankyrin repeat protein